MIEWIWSITWCQFWLELLIFFTEPGWRTLISLQRKRHNNQMSVFRGNFENKQKWTWVSADISVSPLTRTTGPHPSDSPWSCPQSFCQSHPQSTFSAPLPCGGRTYLQADRGMERRSQLIWFYSCFVFSFVKKKKPHKWFKPNKHFIVKPSLKLQT